jgi:hypothetical protein
MPTVHAEETVVSAGAELAAGAIEAGQAEPEAGGGWFSRLRRFFDGGRSVAPETSVPGYLQTSPDLDLGPVERFPTWSPIEKGGFQPRIKFHATGEEVVMPDEDMWSGFLDTEETSEVLPEVAAPHARGISRGWRLPDDAKQAVEAYGNVFWIDDRGRLVRYFDKTRTITRFKSPEGQVLKFMPAPLDKVFVVIGQRVEIWDLILKKKRTLSAADFDARTISHFVMGEDSEDAQNIMMYYPGGRLRSRSDSRLAKCPGALHLGAAEGKDLVPVGNGYYYREIGRAHV